MPSTTPPIVAPGSEHLPVATKLAFGIGNFPIMLSKLAPKQLSLPIFNDLLGVNPALVGGFLAVARIVDAATDTIMGHVSDRTTSRWGRRRPYIFGGAFLTGICFASIWMFPRGLTQGNYFAWFAVTSSLFYLALTVFSVPWYALGYELPSNYDERTRLQAYANVFAPLGQIVVAWFYPITQWRGFGDTIAGVRFVGIGAGLVLLAFGLIPAIFLREPRRIAAVAKKDTQPKAPSFFAGVRAAAQCGPFVRLTIAFTAILIGSSFSNSLRFYLITYYLYAGDRVAGSALLGWSFTASCLSVILLTPLAAKFSIRFGKKEIFLFALYYGIARCVLLWFLLDPQRPWLLLVDRVLAGFDDAAIFMLCHAMISDICDLDELQSGTRREGLFGALYGWIYKTGNALSLAAVGSMLVLIGFQTGNAKHAIAQSPHTLSSLKVYYCFLPAIASMVGIVLMRKYTITRAAAETIRQKLLATSARAGR